MAGLAEGFSGGGPEHPESGLPGFFGLSDVQAHSAIYDLTPSQSDVVVIRRAYLESVHLSSQPLAKPADGIPESSPAAD